MQALLLLADGRFPAGGHAHSAGVEAAVADGRVVDVSSLAAFAEGRLRTSGLVDAAVAMATATRLAQPLDRPATRSLLTRLDAEVDARTPAPPLRTASRRLGRQLLRVAARCWPSPLLDLAAAPSPGAGREAVAVDGPRPTGLDPDGASASGRAGGPGLHPHQAVAFGVVGVAARMAVEDVGHLVAHHAVTTPMQAGVRLLGLDPFAVAAATAGLAEVAAAVVADAARYASRPLEDLPARSATLVDVAAVGHAAADGRLFAT